MMSGMQPSVTGIYNNQQPISGSSVANNSLFMPQHFKNNGYYTLIAGKIFHTKPSSGILQNMWDDMSNIDGGYGPFFKTPNLPQNLQGKWQDYQEWEGPDADFPDVRNSQKVIDFLGQKHDKPFFVAMGFYRPHTPWTAPKRYFDEYDVNAIKLPVTIPDDLNDIPAYAIDHFIGQNQINKQKILSSTGKKYWQQMVRAYLACVSFADDRIGMILDALDKSPYSKNTLIVLVGDNGYHHGEKERWGKSALWREACHVPLIIAGPKDDKRIKSGKCESVVNSIDLYPTLIDACNLPKINNQLAGSSLMSLLLDPGSKRDKPSITTFLPGNFGVHSGKWNYIHYVDGSQELYDVSGDENEFVNLAGKPKYKSTIDSLSIFLPKTWLPGIDEATEKNKRYHPGNANQLKNAGKKKRKRANSA